MTDYTVDDLEARIFQIEDHITTLQKAKHRLMVQRAHLRIHASPGDYLICERKSVNPVTFAREHYRVEGVLTDTIDAYYQPEMRVLRRGTTLTAFTESITPGVRVTNMGPWKGAHND